MQAVTKNILKFTATGLVAGVAVVPALRKLFCHAWCGNARTFRRCDSRNCPSKRCLAVRQLTKNLHYTHPMKEDVKKKDFSPPLGKMRVW
jgi:hypothetical protein